MNEHFSDFYKVPNIAFDIKKLRAELDRVLKQKKFNTLGITNFAAIPINRVPGDADSIKGHNVRGEYWTFPDETDTISHPQSLKNKSCSIIFCEVLLFKKRL